jgi:predicted RNA-binding protein with PIN domain
MARVDAELRAERRARRSREDDAELRVELARRRAEELERGLAVERQRCERAVAESEDAEERARVASDEARRAARARDELADRLVATETALGRSAAPGIGLRYQDLQLLWESAVAAEGLAQGLVSLARHAQDAAASAGLALTSTHQLPEGPPHEPPAAPRPDDGLPADPRPDDVGYPAGPGRDHLTGDLDLDGPGPGGGDAASERRPERPGPPAVPPPRRRRAPVPVPPGMVADSAEAVAGAMVSGGRLAVLVDGYNVAMRAWPDAPPANQRERLGVLVAQWQLLTRTAVTVVFDGADIVAGAAGGSRRSGVRTLFSGPSEEADDVIVREVAALPLDRPAIVASSDRELRRRVAAEGALPIGADVLLELVRR